MKWIGDGVLATSDGDISKGQDIPEGALEDDRIESLREAGLIDGAKKSGKNDSINAIIPAFEKPIKKAGGK